MSVWTTHLKSHLFVTKLTMMKNVLKTIKTKGETRFCKLLLVGTQENTFEDVEVGGDKARGSPWQYCHCPAVGLRWSPGCPFPTWLRMGDHCQKLQSKGREPVTMEKDPHEGPLLEQRTSKRWKGQKALIDALSDWLPGCLKCRWG